MRPFDGVESARVRVKICGITRSSDAVAAVRSGADAIGLVFYARSPRAVDIDTARSIVQTLPPFVSKVGLFVDAVADEVENVLNEVALDLLQFHGDETPAYCRQFNRPFIKAVRIREETDLAGIEATYYEALALLVDAYVEGQYGGTGQTFDWSGIPAGLAKPLILAGGLNVDNVRSAIEQVKPYAVDVSGGVESQHGIKDHMKIAEFIREVSNADK